MRPQDFGLVSPHFPNDLNGLGSFRRSLVVVTELELVPICFFESLVATWSLNEAKIHNPLWKCWDTTRLLQSASVQYPLRWRISMLRWSIRTAQSWNMPGCPSPPQSSPVLPSPPQRYHQDSPGSDSKPWTLGCLGCLGWRGDVRSFHALLALPIQQTAPVPLTCWTSIGHAGAARQHAETWDRWPSEVKAVKVNVAWRS